MKHLFLLAALSLSTHALAQSQQGSCSTVYSSSWETPEFNTARINNDVGSKSTATYTIPVVFHIVHDSGPENVSSIAVNNAFNVLNSRFANQSPYMNVDGVNTDISFCLASQDPDGNATTGIVYHTDEATDYDQYRADNGLPATYPVDSLIKSLYHWPTDRYLNIYIVRSMNTAQSSTATFPDMHGNFMDGLMTIYNALMQEGLAHEAGHYFGLYHTFQGTCTNNDCMNDNDKVCDTPPDAVAEYDPQNCEVNTCSTDEDDISNNNPFRSAMLGGLGDQNDDTKNYMDISACSNKKFTQGQKERMHATISTVRSSLLTSPACQPVSVNNMQKGKISIYPNPATDRLNINNSRNCLATLFNALGQVAVKEQVDNDIYEMNITSLPDGIYMLSLTDQKGTKNVSRIIKR